MKRLKSFSTLLFFLLIPLIGNLFAQEKLDVTPFPVGGMQTIANNVVYPAEAKKDGIEGTVFVKAVISQTGDVLSAEVIKSADRFLDEAAIKAVKATKFSAGQKDGKNVKAEVTVPIKFKLNDKK